MAGTLKDSNLICDRLLIFEGFDETDLVGDAEMRVDHFRTLWGFCHPGAKILITGRPNFFFDRPEMAVALGTTKERKPDRPHCDAIRLNGFDLNQIEEALRKHDQTVSGEICDLARENEQFRELISRPSLLHIVAGLWVGEELSNHVKELTSAFVLGRFVHHSYRRHGAMEHGAAEGMALTAEEREYFMRGVATYMAARRLPNQIAGRRLNEAIAALVEAIPKAVSKRTPRISPDHA